MIILLLIVPTLFGYGYSANFRKSKRQVSFEEELPPGPSQCFFLGTTPGACTSLDQCPALRSLILNPTPNNLSILRRSTCGFTVREPLVCCPLETPIVPPVTPNPVNPHGPGVNPAPIREQLPTVCGQVMTSNTRIVDGEPAAKGAWPWIALLGYQDNRGVVDFACGGSLITSRHILTAAHCVFDKEDLAVVRLGEHDLESTSDGANPIDVKIVKKKVHERYDSKGKSWQNDIAILTLERPVPFSDDISPVCLPVQPQLRNENYTRLSPFVAGWGTTEFQGKSSNLLLQAQVVVTSQDKCSSAYKRFNALVIDQRVLCAGAKAGGRQDACQGDSGGPLMIPRGDSYYQIGVVSFGFKCAEKDFPGVYTRTGAFIDWILENLN